VSVPGRLRASPQNGAIVAQPPLSDAGAMLESNRHLFQKAVPDLLGQSWNELRSRARDAAIAAAKAYFVRTGEPIPDVGDISLVMAGHQPELFHPGVLIKNFALNGLARSYGATPLNLVVDNDTAKTTALRLPALEPKPHVVNVSFDHWAGEVQYEERSIRDEALFESLPEHAAPYMRNWNFTPLLPKFWAEVCRQAPRAPILGDRLAGARRVWERRWGCHNLEVPVSAVCGTEPFAWFACHLLRYLPRFHAAYNDCVKEFRARYGIRSRNHPVPLLAAEGDWLELPFWAWRKGETRRGRLFARTTEYKIELRVGTELWPVLPSGAGHDCRRITEGFADLERTSFKIRSRALTNTLYARLFLADLFIHGIGGGIYDELTDDIIRRFYQLEPPAFLVLSATLLLPLPTSQVGAEGSRAIARQLRDLRFNPQRHLDGRADSSADRLVRDKQDWIARAPSDATGRKERFHALRSLTERLRSRVADQEANLREQLTVCEHEVQANAIMRRRDYAFCLYPEWQLRPFCEQFLQPQAVAAPAGV
jgi:hypothetical protein